MWEAAQKDRPSVIASSSRIAPVGEPGTPLVVHGRTEPPAPGAIIFAYHTDNTGVYGRNGWRLRGWARTNEKGEFEFTTIRPAPYPGRNIPAHIHFTIERPNRQMRSDELEFTEATRVTVMKGVQHVIVTLR
jgi:protocatechuate 3,4-dioxygenase beta subunit